MDIKEDFTQLRLLFTDPVQCDQEVIRPLVQFAQSVNSRSRDTEIPRITVKRRAKQFVIEGMLGLVNRGEIPHLRTRMMKLVWSQRTPPYEGRTSRVKTIWPSDTQRGLPDSRPDAHDAKYGPDEDPDGRGYPDIEQSLGC